MENVVVITVIVVILAFIGYRLSTKRSKGSVNAPRPGSGEVLPPKHEN